MEFQFNSDTTDVDLNELFISFWLSFNSNWISNDRVILNLRICGLHSVKLANNSRWSTSTKNWNVNLVAEDLKRDLKVQNFKFKTGQPVENRAT